MSVDEVDLATSDPFGPAWRQDPWPIYQRLQAEAPVLQRAPGAWLVTRYDDCRAVLLDRRFGSDPAHLSDRALEAIGANEVYREGSGALLFMDPPDHTRLRSLISKAFTPRVVADLRPWMEDFVETTLDGVVDAGELEVMEQLAYPLPVEVICQLLGVPDTDRTPFRAWSSAASRLLDGNLSVEAQQAGLEGSVALFTYFAELVEARRVEPADDLLSGLVTIEDEGDHLTSDELLTMVVLLFVAGHETTMNLIGNGLLALIDHPDQMALLRADLTLARGAIDESLRFAGPVQLAPRVALESIELGGHIIDAGDSVILGIAAANRDPDQFDDAARFDIVRADASSHLAFSLGAHHCLGASLARLEAEVVLAAVARRLPDLQIAGDRPVFRDHAIVRGLEALPVTFTTCTTM